VCDITGTDRDVEVCDVTIAGQLVKLDLSPEGAQKLREFFGPVVVVHHPLEAGSAVEAEVTESIADEQTTEESVVEAAQSEPEPEPAAEKARPARRGRKPASVKTTRKKGGPRRAVSESTVQATSEIREWARANGFEVGDRGAIPGRIRSAYALAHE
jgi:hypothetical protein